MKKFFLLLIVSLAFGCKKDLIGNWHLKINDNEEYNFSMDILENQDSYLYSSLLYNPTIRIELRNFNYRNY